MPETVEYTDATWLRSIPAGTRVALHQVSQEYLGWQGEVWVTEAIRKVIEGEDPGCDIREDIKKQIMTKKAPVEVPSVNVLRNVAAAEGVLCPEDLVVTLVRQGAKRAILEPVRIED